MKATAPFEEQKVGAVYCDRDDGQRFIYAFTEERYDQAKRAILKDAQKPDNPMNFTTAEGMIRNINQFMNEVKNGHQPRIPRS